MCAQFYPVADPEQLAKLYKAKLDRDLQKIQWDAKVLPHGLAPVVLNSNAGLIIKPMKFSMVPSWSKDPKVKFATYNARIETVLEKPMWKKPFLSSRCIVPIVDFIEPIYIGEHAGHMMDFYELERGPLSAAAISDTWVNKETGEIIESFAIITGEPLPFVKTVGHDRSPFFIKHSAVEEWLSPDKKTGEELMNLLKRSRDNPGLQAKSERPMKAGWEKRR